MNFEKAVLLYIPGKKSKARKDLFKILKAEMEARYPDIYFIRADAVNPLIFNIDEIWSVSLWSDAIKPVEDEYAIIQLRAKSVPERKIFFEVSEETEE